MKKIIALLLVFCFSLCLFACGNGQIDIPVINGSEESSSSEAPVSELPPSSDSASEVPSSEMPSSEVPSSEAPVSELPSSEAPTSEAPVSEVPSQSEAPSSEAPSSQPQQDNSPAAILKELSDAINKTKGYKSPITVNHKESFDIVEPVVTLDKGGEALSNLATKAINFVKGLVLKPTEEVYKFSNGIATTSENEKTQLLLPKDGAFAIGVDAVASASRTKENGMTRIKLTLTPEETHSLAEVPKNHAASIGYLDLDGEFKIIQIQELNIKYPGSTIDALIREDGYVQSVTYVINLQATSRASGMGLSGGATFSGSQTEVWNINW